VAVSYAREAARAFRGIAFFARDVRAKPLDFMEVILYASFLALALYRIAHFLSALGLLFVPRFLNQAARLLTGIEIHPWARIGPGMFIDHGMCVVIGSNVLVYHGVPTRILQSPARLP